MSDPEHRYHAWLRAYPKAYRTDRGQEILATLLDSSEHGRPPLRDLLFIIGHASRVWVRLIVKGPGTRPLPQPVRLVTWVLVGSAAINWYGVIFPHNGPKNPSSHVTGIVAGFVCLGLNFLLQARRRLLYELVIAAFAASIAFEFLVVTQHVVWLIMESINFVVTVLLLAGWRRYMAAIAHLESGRRAPSGL